MPKPKDEDDDLFHSEEDLDLGDDDGDEPFGGEAAPKKKAKKTVKKKTAKKKVAKKKTAKKATKKQAKKKAPAQEELFDDEPEAEEAPAVEEDLDEAAEAPAADEAPTEGDADGAKTDEDADEYGRPKPAADYVVHIYDLGRFKRTIDREFIPEDAEAFATEFTRTAKHYGRKAVSGKKDTAPAKVID